MIHNIRPLKTAKINILRTMILKMTLLFSSVGSMVAMQQEDGGLWIHWFLKEANGGDHKK